MGNSRMSRQGTSLEQIPGEDTTVRDFAQDNGLTIIPTGGGFDFPGVQYPGDGPTLFIENPWNGEGPKALDDPAAIICYADNDEWRQGIQVFPADAEGAMTLLGDPLVRSALIWKALEHTELDPDQKPSAADHVSFEAIADNYSNMTYSEIADKILEQHRLSDLHVIEDPALQDQPALG